MKTQASLLFGLPLLYSLIAPAQDSVLLRREFKSGEETKYAMTVVTKQTIDAGSGDQEATVDGSMNVSYKITGVNEAKDKADIKATFSDISLKFGGMAAMAEGMMGEMPKTFSVTAKMDKLGNVSESKVEGLSQQQMMLAGSSQSMAGISGVVFPEKPLKVGESWNMPISKNEMMGIDASTIKATLSGEKTIDGISTWEIEIAGKLPLKMDTSKMPQGADPTGGSVPATNMTMKGTYVIKSKAWVEKTSGKLIAMEGTADTDQTMDLVDMGMTVGVKGTIKTSLKLSK